MARERKNNLFKQVPIPNVKRNLFDLSHEVKMSGKFGYLYPILCMDTLPGDTIRDEMNVLLRFATMLAPVMHRCDVTTHFFFVPCRLLTDAWEEFITGGQDGTAAPVLPYITPAGMAAAAGGVPERLQKGSLWDYLGLPVFSGSAPASWSTERVSILPFRACAKVWNDYYMDPNLGTEMALETELEGDVSSRAATGIYTDLNRYRRGFEKDYFTSALPFAQRGAQVLMPLAAEITYREPSLIRRIDSGQQLVDGDLTTDATSGSQGNTISASTPGPTTQVYIDNIESIENASTTINDLRRAIAVQRWMENNARGGARYIEQIEGHFNVRVPDYRLQRAEYLGGGKQPVQISEVLATAEDAANDVYVGDMRGHGISVGRTNRFTYRCQEHGYVVGFLSVTMRTAYDQGIPKLFSRADKFDFGWPELANLGEQEITSKEVFYSFDAADDDDNALLFGYIPRYAEYKFHNDRVAGDFRDSLGFWHLGRNFTSRPSLDVNFTTIYEDGGGEEESFRRIFAVQDGTDYLWMQLYHRLTAKRPLPYFGVPTF